MNKSLLTVRRVVTVVWLGALSVQFVIWVLMCLIGWHFADPSFWLWPAAVGGVIVGGLWAVKDGANR